MYCLHNYTSICAKGVKFSLDVMCLVLSFFPRSFPSGWFSVCLLVLVLFMLHWWGQHLKHQMAAVLSLFYCHSFSRSLSLRLAPSHTISILCLYLYLKMSIFFFGKVQWNMNCAPYSSYLIIPWNVLLTKLLDDFFPIFLLLFIFFAHSIVDVIFLHLHVHYSQQGINLRCMMSG